MKHINSENYTFTETDESINLKAKKANKDGFIINVSFSKDTNEHEDAMKSIKEFFVREVL